MIPATNAPIGVISEALRSIEEKRTKDCMHPNDVGEEGRAKDQHHGYGHENHGWSTLDYRVVEKLRLISKVSYYRLT